MKKIHVLLIFAVAFLIRLIFLNQSLWLDEATTAKAISQYDYFGIISKFTLTDFHPPLYYIFMKFWSAIFGHSEITLRMPSVLFSLGAGYFVYLMGGIWAAVFFLFNPLVVYYSQEARMYSMAVFFLTGALYYLKKLSMKSIAEIIFFNVFTILALYTFYGSVFLIIPMFAYLFYKKNYRVFFMSAIMFGVYAALLMPLTLAQLKNSKVALSQIANWSSVLGKANLKNLLLFPIKFSVGRIDFFPKALYYALSGAWTAIVLLGLKNAFKKENRLWTYLFVTPVILGLFVSIFSPLLQYFRFIYLIPLMAVLLAATPDNKRNTFKILLATGFVVFSLAYLLVPQFHREDWKKMAGSFGKGSTVYMVASSSDPVKYYRGDLNIVDLREIPKSAKERSLTVIPYTADIHGIDYKKILTDKGYRLKEVESFRDLNSERWVK